MPKIKTDILGSSIEINYNEEEKDKLILVIKKFKERLSKLKNLEGKVSDKKILFLAALQAEDEGTSNELVSDAINLKDENKKLKQINQSSVEELDRIEKKINLLFNKIVNLNDDDN